MSRFRVALLGALALHGAFFLVRSRHATSTSQPAQLPPLQYVEVTEPAPEETPAPSEAAAPEAAVAANAPPVAARAGTGTESAAVVAEGAPASEGLGTEGATEGAGTGAPSPVGSAEASAPPARKIDLHLGDGFFMVPPSGDGPRVARVGKPNIQRLLEASISADDVKRGLARGNALLGSLNAAVRDGGPVRGEALLSVTVGADGSLTGVQFLRGSAGEWSSAMEAFRALVARKRVRVPPGARGMRVTYSVQAKVQLPSGKAVGSPVDIEPSGLALQGTFDVADIGANAQRLVYARVVSEEVL